MRRQGNEEERGTVREKEDVKVNRSRYIKCDQTAVVWLRDLFLSKVVAMTQS